MSELGSNLNLPEVYAHTIKTRNLITSSMVVDGDYTQLAGYSGYTRSGIIQDTSGTVCISANIGNGITNNRLLLGRNNVLSDGLMDKTATTNTIILGNDNNVLCGPGGSTSGILIIGHGNTIDGSLVSGFNGTVIANNLTVDDSIYDNTNSVYLGSPTTPFTVTTSTNNPGLSIQLQFGSGQSNVYKLMFE